MKARGPLAVEEAERIAIQALNYIAADAGRLGTFLAVTGMGPEQIRAISGEPGFLAGVVEYLVGDERLLTEFAAEMGLDPLDVSRAQVALGGTPWEREMP